MTPKERWTKILETIEEVRARKEYLEMGKYPTGAHVVALIGQLDELDKHRARTLEELIFSDSERVNRAALFECDCCGVEVRVTDVTCPKCSHPRTTIEARADGVAEAKRVRAEGVPDQTDPRQEQSQES